MKHELTYLSAKINASSKEKIQKVSDATGISMKNLIEGAFDSIYEAWIRDKGIMLPLYIHPAFSPAAVEARVAHAIQNGLPLPTPEEMGQMDPAEAARRAEQMRSKAAEPSKKFGSSPRKLATEPIKGK